MDNPNPVSLSLDEIRKQNEARSRRNTTKQSNLWIPNWESLDQQNSSHSNNVIPGVTPISEVNTDREEFDAEEIFELIRNLTDPEHPLTLEQLSVVSPELITVNDKQSTVDIKFTPTIPHCSQATLIGLMIKVKLSRCLPLRFKVTVRITPGTHNTEDAINKQLNDKERVAAALENPSVLKVINRGTADTDEIAKWSII